MVTLYAVKDEADLLIDDLLDMEGNKEEFYATLNLGKAADGSITGAVDIHIHPKYKNDQSKIDEIKTGVEAIFENHGFELDDRFDINPGKTLFGAIHYQIKKSKDDFDGFFSNTNITESLNESVKDDIFDMLDEIGGYTDYDGRIDAVVDEFNIDRDRAEDFVWEWCQLSESLTEEATMGSVEDFLKKMEGKSKAEAEKIVKKAKGNPNADKAYQKYLEINEGIDIESTGVRRMPLYMAREAVDKFNEDAKNYPFWVIKTSRWYDPEGLGDVGNSNFTIEYAGTEAECKNKIKQIIAEAERDKDYQNIEESGEDFVKIYYPRAIAKAMFSIKKNDALNEDANSKGGKGTNKNDFLTKQDVDAAKWLIKHGKKATVGQIKKAQEVIKRYEEQEACRLNKNCQESFNRDRNDEHLTEDYDSVWDIAAATYKETYKLYVDYINFLKAHDPYYTRPNFPEEQEEDWYIFYNDVEDGYVDMYIESLEWFKKNSYYDNVRKQAGNLLRRFRKVCCTNFVGEVNESLKESDDTLRTVDYGTIKIVPCEKITKFDKFIKNDLADEWSYYQTTDGEVVATKNECLKESVDWDSDPDKMILDSYNHFAHDLGETPSVDDILEDIMNNYNQTYFKDNTPEEAERSYRGILSCLRDNRLEYTMDENLNEDTEKVKDGKWVNKGKEGTHGKFKTKKEADAQRKAMFSNGFHESLEGDYDPSIYEPRQRTALDGKVWWVPYDTKNKKYSTIVRHGRYKTKKECQYDIEHCFDY